MILSYDPLFFFNDTATTDIYTLSLHDALPISPRTARPARAQGSPRHRPAAPRRPRGDPPRRPGPPRDRKSTRLNSSHVEISYAVFCLKKKKNIVVRGRTPLANNYEAGWAGYDA